MQTNTITIIGMNRIGVSIALALKQGPLDFKIIGYDSNQRVLQNASAVEGALDLAEKNLTKAVTNADIVVLAVPVIELEGVLIAIGSLLQEHTLVIDLGSLKGPAIKWAQEHFQQGHYIGARPVLAAHQLADESAAPQADLFQKSVFCIMASAHVDPKAVDTAVNFGRLLGSQPYFIDPLEYDSLVQGVETLPGLVSAAMFSALHQAKGWRDMVRFADWPFAVTTLPLESRVDNLALLALNDKAATMRWISAAIEELQNLQRWVYHGDGEALTALLENMQDDRARWLHERQKNEWLEQEDKTTVSMSASERLFGGFLGGHMGGGKE